MPTTKMVDGVEIEMTPEEIAAFEASRQPRPPTTEQLLAYTANKRWQVETGGITVSGVPVHTDDRSKLMIMGARLEAMGNPALSKSWVGADGNVYPLDASAIIAISDAVAAHVTACFEAFAAVRDAIIAGEMTAHAQIDTAFAAL